MNSSGTDRCWAEVDRAALRHNARVARERVGPKVALLAVVKANGYGHGMVEVAAAVREEAQIFGVANLHEAQELRASGLPHPILILGPSLPQERAAIHEQGFIPSVSSFEEARAFAGNRGGINFAIDTGMGRMGCWQDDAIAELGKISQLPDLISTASRPICRSRMKTPLLPKASSPSSINSLGKCGRAFPAPSKCMSCSAPAFSAPRKHRFDIVRAGLMLYGSAPLPAEQKFLQPVLALKSRVALLRDLPAGRSISYGRTFTTARPMRVATISAGYADGYPALALEPRRVGPDPRPTLSGTRPHYDGPDHGGCDSVA